MIPWQHLGSALVPDNGGELRLYRRGDEFSIRADRFELMNSRFHGSEEALSEIACSKIADRRSPHLLIGGLGMGYTLAAALRHLGPEGRVTVAELVPEVVDWNRGPLAELAGNPLRDARVTIREVDVGRLLRKAIPSYDAILLDVDNGPEGLTRRDNDWLYAHAGLNAAFHALRPAGVLAVWSATPDRVFTARLRRIGFRVEEIRMSARGNRGNGPHTIWIAIRHLAPARPLPRRDSSAPPTRDRR